MCDSVSSSETSLYTSERSCVSPPNDLAMLRISSSCPLNLEGRAQSRKALDWDDDSAAASGFKSSLFNRNRGVGGRRLRKSSTANQGNRRRCLEVQKRRVVWTRTRRAWHRGRRRRDREWYRKGYCSIIIKKDQETVRLFESKPGNETGWHYGTNLFPLCFGVNCVAWSTKGMTFLMLDKWGM